MRSSLRTLDSSSPPPPSDELAPGAQAGPWTIEHVLGRGGMGTVYAVRHARIGKRAALKVVHRYLVGPGLSAERMLLEAQVVNRIGHPNIIDIFETGTTDDGRPYLVMERLTGHSLHDRTHELPPEESIAILLQVCDALIAAHDAGVIHRDLKPDNVFLADGPDGRRVKLLDWGIARLLDVDARHTLDGQLVGTPQYLAPEQARGADVSPASDVYSLGVVAFELLLDQLPFEAATPAEILAMHLRDPLPEPRALWPGIPPTLDALLRAMLAKLPEQRPTMRQVAAMLETVRRELDDARRQQFSIGALDASGSALGSTFTRKLAARRRWQASLGVLAAVAGITLFAVSRIDSRPHRRAPPPAPKPVEQTTVERARPAPLAIANPVIEDCADPGMLHARGRWYVACTGGKASNVFPLYESSNLRDWRRLGWIFPSGTRPVWGTASFWAPELHETPRGIAAYFSMRSDGTRNAIGVATARSPAGPYTDRGDPLLARKQGASDAHLLRTTAGAYLYYRAEGAHDAIWAAPLSADGLDVRGASVPLLEPSEPWERGTVEAPWVLEHAGMYYLFYSAGRYCSAEYAVGVARATSPLGPFEKLGAPILASGPRWLGPGHVSITDDDRGLVIAYHAYRAADGTPYCEPGHADDNNTRHVLLARLVFANGWPQVIAER
ncbi:MAG TPA: family 43 glycosylhydrolase [Kofleriaceae bacterium]|nr:family 43 glycosylhydrolase [Kofleriaceae bacterium]